MINASKVLESVHQIMRRARRHTVIEYQEFMDKINEKFPGTPKVVRGRHSVGVLLRDVNEWSYPTLGVYLSAIVVEKGKDQLPTGGFLGCVSPDHALYRDESRFDEPLSPQERDFVKGCQTAVFELAMCAERLAISAERLHAVHS